MARALLITNPAAARTQQRAVAAVMRALHRSGLGRRGARHRRPRRRAPASPSTAWPRGWTWWRSSGATARRCRRPPRWWGPRWRWGSFPGVPATCSRGTSGFPPRPRGPRGRWSRGGPARSTSGGWSGPAAPSTSPWPAAPATTPGSWPRRSRSTSGAGGWWPTRPRRSGSSAASGARPTSSRSTAWSTTPTRPWCWWPTAAR